MAQKKYNATEDKSQRLFSQCSEFERKINSLFGEPSQYPHIDPKLREAHVGFVENAVVHQAILDMMKNDGLKIEQQVTRALMYRGLEKLSALSLGLDERAIDFAHASNLHITELVAELTKIRPIDANLQDLKDHIGYKPSPWHETQADIRFGNPENDLRDDIYYIGLILWETTSVIIDHHLRKYNLNNA